MFLLVYLLFFFINISKITSYISASDFLLMPKIFHLDNYDKCMLFEDEAFYCSITFQLRPANNQSQVWKLIEGVSSDLRNYRHDLLRHGLCIPETYPSITPDMYHDRNQIRHELNKLYNEKYSHLGLKGDVTKMHCQTEKSPYVVDIYSKLFQRFVFWYFVVIAVATLYEELLRHGDEQSYKKRTGSLIGRICVGLSVRKNWQRLMTVQPPSEDIQAVSFMQAIRLYIMLTVILCHTMAAYLAGPLTNIYRIEKKMQMKTWRLQIDSALSMQTFFIMTSWLLSYHFFVVHEHSRRISFRYLASMFVKRYIRLTPILAFTVLYACTWMVHFSNGPVWDDYVGDPYRKCRENWWTNLLYINNFVNKERMCLTHTWFLATNTQLYVLSLPLLYLMWKYQKKIWLTLGTVVVCHVTYLFYIIFVNRWHHTPPPVLEAVYNEQFIQWRQWHELWTSTWSNLAGLVAGLIYGYVFYKIRNQKLELSKVYLTLGWAIGFGVPLLLAIFDEMVDTDDPFFNALYGSTKRVLFSFSVGLAMLLMAKLKGGIISWLYESKPLYILGRLTYSIYVVHPILQRILHGSKRTLSYTGENVVYLRAVGDFTLALIVGTVMCLLVEMPIMELYKLFTSRQDGLKVDAKVK